MSFSEPSQIIDMLELRDGMQVADLGSGSGFYSLAASKAVSPSGAVFAIDIQKELLDRLKDEASRHNAHNITTIWGNAEEREGTRLREDSIDVVVLANTLFQIPNKEGALQEMSRILKSKGRVLLVEWTGSFGGLGPQADQVITQEAAQQLFESHGYTLISSTPAGDNHYALIFEKSV